MARKFGLLITALTIPLIMVSGFASAFAQGVRIPVGNASIRILKEVQLSTEIPGIMTYVNPTEEGQQVRKGEVVIRLKDDVIQAQLTEAIKKSESNVEIKFAETALAKAQIDYDVQLEKNSKRPADRPVFTDSEMRQSQLEVQKAQAQLEKSNEDKIVLQLAAKTKEAELGQYTVYAPDDGVVTQVHKWPGQAVRQGDPVLTITDLTLVRAVLLVHYSYRDQISIGNQVELRIGSRQQAPVTPENSIAPESDGQRGKGILDGAPGLRGSTTARQPVRVAAAEPVPSPFASQDPATREKFVGTVTFISPKLTTTGELEVFVNVPNRQDEEGRYLLQQGVTVDAWIMGN